MDDSRLEASKLLVGFSGQCCLDFAYQVGVSSYEFLHSYAEYVLGRM